MSNIRVMWGADGCDEIIKQLNSLKSAVKSMETELPEHLARVGQNSAEAKTASVGVMGLDGNQLGGFYILEHTDYVELVNQGEDVAFIEFGTGMMGQQSPHPLAGEAGWEYYTPTRYKRSVGGRKGWFYKNKLTGELTFTEGMVGTKAMYEARFEIFKAMFRDSKEILHSKWLR